MRIFKALLLSLICVFGAYGQLNTEKILTIGRNALYYKDYVLSIQYFNQVIKAKPYLAEPHYYRSMAKYNLGDYLGAKDDCDKALERNPYLVNAYNLRGICFLNLQDYERSEQDMDKGLKYDPENAMLIMNRGLSNLYQGDYEEAIQDFTKTIKKNSSHMQAYLSRGEAYVRSGDTIAGGLDYSKAIEINPYNARSYLVRGNLLMQIKKYVNAEEDFDMALRLVPDDAATYLNRGITRYFKKQYVGALADIDKSIELEPNRSAAYFNRGLIRTETGDLNRAVEDFSMTLSFEANNYFALYNRGLLYLQLGQYFNALDDFDHVLREYPDFTNAYYARSDVKKKIGDKAGAQLDVQTAFAVEVNKGERQKGDTKLPPGASYVSSGGKSSKRNENDQNIRNYKSIVVMDETKESEKGEFDSDIRGQIQDRNIIIDLERAFTLGTKRDSKFAEGQLDYFARILNTYNREQSQSKLYLLNDNIALTEEEIEAYFKRIDDLTQQIGLLSNNRDLYFQRAMLYDQVKDFNASLQDINRVIEIDRKFMLAYFYRATVRFKMVEFVLSLDNEVDVSQGNGLLLSDSQTSTQKEEGEKRILDYDLIMYDLSMVLSNNPEFSYAFFNRGYVRCVLKDYHAAINDFSLAISLEPDMAEAYFNRGLTYIYLGNEAKGSKDLSKAGELGLFKAYNVLKRFGLQN